MARQLKGFALLDGARGRPAADTGALADIMQRLAALALACTDARTLPKSILIR